MKLEVRIEISDFTSWRKKDFPWGMQSKTGVYVHGVPKIFDGKPVDPLSEDVYYIGVATFTFNSRLQKFYRTLTKGYDHHAGSCNHTGAEKARAMGLTIDDFYSALCPIPSIEECHLAERMLLHAYFQKHGRLPQLNNH